MSEDYDESKRIGMELGEFMVLKAAFLDELRDILSDDAKGSGDEILEMLVDSAVSDLDLLAKICPPDEPMLQFGDVDQDEFRLNLMHCMGLESDGPHDSGSDSSGSSSSSSSSADEYSQGGKPGWSWSPMRRGGSGSGRRAKRR